MRLQQLTLTNFRGFEALALDLDRDLTLIYGDNGVGKSTVIDALAMCLSGLPPGGEGPAPTLADLRFATRSLGGVVSVEHEAEGGAVLRVLVDDEPRDFGWTITRDGAATPSAANARYGKALAKRVDKPELLPLIALFPARRSWSAAPVTPDAPVGRLAGYAGARAAGENLGAMREWWRHQHELAQAGQLPPALEFAERVVRDFLTEAGAPNVEPPVWNVEAKDLRLHVPRLDNYLLLGQLSDGYRAMLALVIDLVRRAAQLNPHASAEQLANVPGFVAIDELDVHLHPSWQRTVLPSLRAAFPSLQWVITTHSPQVLASVQSNDEVVELDNLSPAPRVVSGRDTNAVLREMGVEPSDPRGRERVAAIESALNEHRLEDAQDLLDALAREWTEDDVEIIHLRAALRAER